MRTALALLAIVCVTVATAARALGLESGPLAIVVALTPWVAIASVLTLALAVLAWRRWLVLAALLLLVVQVSWQLPVFVADGPATPTRLTVATINLKFGEGDAQTVVDLVRSRSVDVLALEELTPEALARLHAAGLDDLLPHSIVRPSDLYRGTGLWSVYPLADTRSLAGYASALVSARISVDGTDLTLVAAHPVAPGFLGHDSWSDEYRRLTPELASIPGAVMLLGDLNATRDQVPIRRLEDDGFHDAPDQAGAGLHMTYPAWFPVTPLVAIDHVMVRGTDLNATSLTILDVPGSDHRGLLVTYG